MTNERIIRVIVVDDDVSREVMYKKFFDVLKNHKRHDTDVLTGFAFEPEFCSDFSSASMALERQGLAICVRDVMLTPVWTSREVADLTTQIVAKRMPLILVSALFEKTALPELGSIVRQLNSFPPLLRWADIEAVAAGKSAGETFAIFEYFVNVLLKADFALHIDHSTTISILHFTDMHCGKAKFLAGQASAIKASLGALPVPNFLAITGDIADKGLPEEYAEGLAIIEELLVYDILGKGVSLPTRRILMTPGNHDFCRGLAMAGGLVVTERSAPEESVGLPTFDVAFDPKSTNVRKLGHFGLRGFEDFATQVCAGRVAFDPSAAYRYVADYAYAGLHFIELNVEMFKIPTTQAQLVQLDDHVKSLKKLSRELKDVPSGDCIVLLAHRRDLRDAELWQKNLESVLVPLSSKYRVVLLTGHVHEFAQRPEGNDRSWLSITGSCLGDHPHTASGHRPTALHIALERESGKVNAVIVHLLEQKEGKWVAHPQPPNKCDDIDGRPRWQ